MCARLPGPWLRDKQRAGMAGQAGRLLAQSVRRRHCPARGLRVGRSANSPRMHMRAGPSDRDRPRARQPLPPPRTVNSRSPFSLGPPSPSAGLSFHSGSTTTVGLPSVTRGSW
jgi:hypothetical protein